MTIVLVWGQHLAARRHLIADFTFAHEELIARRVCEVFFSRCFQLFNESCQANFCGKSIIFEEFLLVCLVDG